MVAAATVFAATGTARAATASYVSPSDIEPADLVALSTQGDDAGFMVGPTVTLGILLDQFVGATKGGGNGKISVFTLAPDSGFSLSTARVGRYNGGAPQFADTDTIFGGGTARFNNLFNAGCGVLGGCNYIEIVTSIAWFGAQGTEVDYVVVDGEVVEVASPTPEPAAWALMLIGFAAVAMRMKALRNSDTMPAAA